MTEQEIRDYLHNYFHDSPGMSLTYFIGPVTNYIRIGIISIEHTSYGHLELPRYVDAWVLNVFVGQLIRDVPARNSAYKEKK